MPQLVVMKNVNGILAGASETGLRLNAAGGTETVDTRRRFQLSDHTAILTGGAIEGEGMCRALASFIRDEGLDDIEAVYRAALPFLASEYDRFMRTQCESLSLDPLHHVFFVLAGVAAEEAGDPYRLYLLWTKKKLPQMDGDEIGTAFTIPRNMGLELQMNRFCREGLPLDRALAGVRAALSKHAGAPPPDGPLSWIAIDRDGVRTLD
jgi:hypothetical protein